MHFGRLRRLPNPAGFIASRMPFELMYMRLPELAEAETLGDRPSGPALGESPSGKDRRDGLRTQLAISRSLPLCSWNLLPMRWANPTL